MLAKLFNIGLFYRVPVSKLCLVHTLQHVYQFSLDFNETMCSIYKTANEISPSLLNDSQDSTWLPKIKCRSSSLIRKELELNIIAFKTFASCIISH